MNSHQIHRKTMRDRKKRREERKLRDKDRIKLEDLPRFFWWSDFGG